MEQRLHRGFSQTHDVNVAADENTLGVVPQEGNHQLLKEGDQLGGRPGEHDGGSGGVAHSQSGSGAVVIGEDHTALGHHGLLLVVRGHDPPRAGEEVPYSGEGLIVEIQIPPEIGGHGLLGKIVVGRPQPTTQYHQIGGRTSVPLKGIRQSHAESFGVVSHHRLVIHRDSQRGKSLRKEGGVGVDDVP